MSPNRARGRRKPVPHTHSRREIATAVAGSAAVVLVTALLIWLLRPGSALTPGSGGLAHRQPRMSWLVVLTIIAIIVLVAYVRNARRWRERLVVVTAGGLFVILVADVAATALWPGGLLRHYTSTVPPTNITIPTTTTTKANTTTTKPGTTAPSTATTTIPTTTSTG